MANFQVLVAAVFLLSCSPYELSIATTQPHSDSLQQPELHLAAKPASVPRSKAKSGSDLDSDSDSFDVIATKARPHFPAKALMPTLGVRPKSPVQPAAAVGEGFVMVSGIAEDSLFVGNSKLSEDRDAKVLPRPTGSWWGMVDPRIRVNKSKALFLDRLDTQDIVQTHSLDCPILAGIAAVLSVKGESYIRSLMFDDLEHGKVYVRLFDAHGRPHTYVMDKERDMSTSDFGGLRYQLSSRSKLWVHMLERAFAAHLVAVARESIPRTKRDSGISPWTVLYSLLGQDAYYDAEGTLTTPWFTMRQDFGNEQKAQFLAVPGSGLGIASLMPGQHIAGLPSGHAFGILSGSSIDEHGVVGVRLFDSLSSRRQIFVPLKDFIEGFSFLFIPVNKNSVELNRLVKDAASLEAAFKVMDEG